MAGKRGVFDDVAIDLEGNALADIEITVTDHSDNAVAIYSSKTGGAKANPFETDATGLVQFWAPPGSYKIIFSDTEIVPRVSDRTVYWESISGDSDGIGGTQLEDGAVTEAKLADSSVEAAKIGSSAIQYNHLADDSVRTAAIQAGAVGASEIATGAVDSAELATGAVTVGKYVLGAAIDHNVGSFSFNQNWTMFAQLEGLTSGAFYLVWGNWATISGPGTEMRFVTNGSANATGRLALADTALGTGGAAYSLGAVGTTIGMEIRVIDGLSGSGLINVANLLGLRFI